MVWWQPALACRTRFLMSPPVVPDQRHWFDLTRNREFPLSGALSILIHAGVLLLLLLGVFRFLFDDKNSGPIELEPVTILEPPGAGNNGHSTELRHGASTGRDVSEVVDNPIAPPSSKPAPPDAEIIAPEVRPMLPDDLDGTPIRPEKLAPLPKLSSQLKGLPAGKSTKGDGGAGPAAGGPSQGTKGDGLGPDAGRITRTRQMRWTMLFSTQNAADYIRQMKSLGVILGVQMQDQTIYLIRDLSRRPAVAERGAKVEDRIFWMDDNPQSVGAMTDELQLSLT